MSQPISPRPGVAKLAVDTVQVARDRHRVPGATYRLQFNIGFTLRDAIELVPYLHSLGITHAYASPLLMAPPGSMHGYDVIDHGRLNPEIGTEDDLAEFAAALKDRGMGLILDAVPNHMSVVGENAWWHSVLEHGPSSPYAGYFDIDWYDSPRPGLHGRLLLPVLGEPYGQALEAGRLQLVFEAGAFSIRTGSSPLPIDPRTYALILNSALESARERLGVDDDGVIELQSIIIAVKHLPARGEKNASRVAEGLLECAVIRRRLGELEHRFPMIAKTIHDSVIQIAGEPGKPSSFAILDELIEAQAYRPCYWRVASDEINYRRFFDVNELAALSTEREDVCRAIHRKLLGWLAHDIADGLRIDHPDGLFDPKQYLDRLQTYYRLAIAQRLQESNPERYQDIDWGRDEPAVLEQLSTGEQDLYVVVEKILGDNERLPTDWACAGTTGYEFIATVNGVFVDPAAESVLTRFYKDFTGVTVSFAEIAYQKKTLIMSASLSSELNTLAHQLDRLAQGDRRSRDFTLNGLRRALREVIACFPVYRSYVNGGVHETDRTMILKAVRRARARNPLLGQSIFDFIRDTLLLRQSPTSTDSDLLAAQRRFAGKFQQVTSPVTAKGIEDTAFYVYNRFVSLNEVGAEPGRWGTSPSRLHKFLADRQGRSPAGLSPLSTHDTKRSEDVRGRLNVLSEIAEEWTDRVRLWSNWNHKHQTAAEDDSPAIPDANEEYLLYQTMVGVWPSSAELPGRQLTREAREELVGRIQAYMKKALCEAKVHSSWINPDQDYEAAVGRFVAGILNPEDSGQFLPDLQQFVDRVDSFGRINSLAQCLIRCTAPGVPDIYQGTEVWNFSLVDPDNRRQVDYASIAASLMNLDGRLEDRIALCQELMANLADPRAKLFVISQALRFRQRHPAVFASGDYTPVEATGMKASHVFAFIQCQDHSAVLTVVPLMVAGLCGPNKFSLGHRGWEWTVLDLPAEFHDGSWVDVFTGMTLPAGRQLPVADVLTNFPLALLEWRAHVKE